MDVELRGAIPADHEWIVRVADHWWGRPIVAVIPRLFLDHFHPTSLIATIGGEPVGFLVAFQSPARPTEGYVHFVGVDPRHRHVGLGRTLYTTFFELAAARGCRIVRAVTSEENTTSIAFHRRLGFNVSDPIENYDRPGQAMVAFERSISAYD